MACRITELVLKCRDPEVLARFWCEVLDFTVLDREEDGCIEIGPREGFGGAQPTIFLVRSDEPKNDHAWLHIDVGQPADASWHVLADPEGNEFCLLKRRLGPL